MPPLRLPYRILFLLLLGVGNGLDADTLRAGAATSNITPTVGQDIIGGFVPYPSKTIHDDLHVRCLVLFDGKTRLAIAVCDLLGIDRVVSKRARALIATRNGIPKEHVLICATHTHSASSALGQARWRLDQTPDAYQQFVAQRIADGVARAVYNLRPAELAFGTVDVPEHVFNRRWHMRPGTVPLNPFGQADQVKMNPPRASPHLTRPAGPTDPTVSFFALREPGGGPPISVFAAYSLHYVGGAGSGHVSADYFAVFCEHLKRLVGPSNDERPPFVALLANGTSGDINNINFRAARPRRKPYEQMRLVGRDVAEKVAAQLGGLTFRRDVALAAMYREPQIAWRRPDTALRTWAEATLAAGPKRDRDLSYIYAGRVLSMAKYPERTTVPLHVLRIGDTCLGTMPFEVFCETGLAYKARAAIQPAFMVELAHGYLGYLPTPGQHRLGGYETWLGTNRVEQLASEKLLAELLAMTEALK